MKLVPNWRDAPRWVSMQLAALGGALQVAWLTVPEDLKLAFPEWSQSAIAFLIFAGILVGRLWDQGGEE